MPCASILIEAAIGSGLDDEAQHLVLAAFAGNAELAEALEGETESSRPAERLLGPADVPATRLREIPWLAVLTVVDDTRTRQLSSTDAIALP